MLMGWYAERGMLYLDIREFEKRRPTSIAPRNSRGISYHYYKRRAVAHFQLKNYDQALASIAKAVELTPGDFSNRNLAQPRCRGGMS